MVRVIVVAVKAAVTPVISRPAVKAGEEPTAVNSKLAGAVRIRVPKVEMSPTAPSVITIFPNEKEPVGKEQPVIVDNVGAVIVTFAKAVLKPADTINRKAANSILTAAVAFCEIFFLFGEEPCVIRCPPFYLGRNAENKHSNCLLLKELPYMSFF